MAGWRTRFVAGAGGQRPPRPAGRDTRIILGHAHISTSQQIYAYVDEAARLDALTRLNKLLGGLE